jgi:hypothetical protein
VIAPGLSHASGGCPRPRRRVIELRSRKARGSIGRPTSNEYLAVRKQSRGEGHAGSVRTVVWHGSAGDRCPYADQLPLSQVPRREALGSTRTLGAGALVDRELRFEASMLRQLFLRTTVTGIEPRRSH